MKETKPTAKAAMTVGSAPSVTGRSSASRRRASSALSGGGGSDSGSALGVAAPARDRDADRRSRRAATSTIGTIHSVALKPSRPGWASTPSPYSSTSAALICCLSLPAAICSRMNARSCSGDRRAGDAQHGAALDAHHLVLDVGQRGARRLRGGAAPRTPGRPAARSAAALMPAPPAASAGAGRATPA